MTYNLSIGILADNAAPKIAKTLASLRQQSIFYLNQAHYRVEVVLVPNGCTDDTVAIADRIFAQPEWQDIQPHTRCRICAIPIAGKSQAWNRYIHELADPSTNYFVLMDADIVFGELETIAYLVQQLVHDAKAWMSIDQPIKHIQLRPPKSPIESMLAQVSTRDRRAAKGITGQLYCARAHKLRQIWMPQGLAVEDDFLRAMILTDRFTGPEAPDRIVFTPGASHVYEAHTGMRALLRHEQRMTIGAIINQFIFDYLRATCNRKLDAGTLVRRQNQRNPQWMLTLIQDGKQAKGWWLLNSSHTFRRFSELQQQSSIGAKIQRLPIVAVASLADWLVFWRANWAVHQGQSWGDW
jgi:glycosyltransferase involved in cell wall biosynthesis